MFLSGIIITVYYKQPSQILLLSLDQTWHVNQPRKYSVEITSTFSQLIFPRKRHVTCCGRQWRLKANYVKIAEENQSKLTHLLISISPNSLMQCWGISHLDHISLGYTLKFSNVYKKKQRYWSTGYQYDAMTKKTLIDIPQLHFIHCIHFSENLYKH